MKLGFKHFAVRYHDSITLSVLHEIANKKADGISAILSCFATESLFRHLI